METYVQIISLDINELPVERIEGRVTGGSVSVDGGSAIRRTCSINFSSALGDTTFTDEYWCLKTKFKLRMGQKNADDIMWEDMGIYVITSFSYSKDLSKINFSIQGRDKMCLLNGELNGAIPAKTDFGQIQEISDSGIIELKKIPIRTIIQEAVREYGHERLDNIIINDLEDYGYQLWEYKGADSLYYFKEVKSGNITYITFDDTILVKPEGQTGSVPISDSSIKYYSTNTLDSSYNNDATQVKLSDKTYYIIKVSCDETAGYHRIDLVYNNDLISNAGETITSMFDKIVSMLGNYEYFYDVKGRFVFQKKKNYLQELYSTADGTIKMGTAKDATYSYVFEDDSTFTSFSINPNIKDIKNDLIVWGERKNNDSSYAIHARCAIDKKPEKYVSPWERYVKVNNEKIKVREANTEYTSDSYDWRELIYQMAVDFYKHNQESDYISQLAAANPQLIKDGKTGYEQYYSDFEGFWRQLYCPVAAEAIDGEEYEDNYWNKKIHTDPAALNFWFDIIDTGGEIDKYSIPNIGDRSIVENGNNVTSIYNKGTPEVQFAIAPDETRDIKLADTAYTPIQVTADDQYLFSMSDQGISAIEKINEMINKYTRCGQGVSFSLIPIFSLQPNTKIRIKDDDYTINTISYNLSYDGLMSIEATKLFKEVI